IKRCPAPCVYNVPQEEYRRSVDEVALFLEGKADELTGQLQTRMKDAASKLEYERAAQLRDQLHAIERSLEKQRTVLGELLDQDVLGFHREVPALEIHLLFFRNGRLTRQRSRLRLPRVSRRLEYIDISHLHAQLTVGSQVVFSDREPDKSGYRLFKVRRDAARDHLPYMFHALTRRLKRGAEEQNVPD